MEGLDHLIEQSRQQKAVIVAVAVRQLAQIVARPEKFIAFGDHNPGRVVVEPKMPFDRRRDLEHTQRNGRARRSCATALRNGLRRKLMCIKVQDVRSWADLPTGRAEYLTMAQTGLQDLGVVQRRNGTRF